ncbi:centrosomal protein of 295 kDa isoform X2 [Archocentrus centrarchus]|uniref:centrosomal protein of 295 kDa isoform X2 n=1 Tax=Archocentrus centrarchus TaxID=63155 RepID=UPI0011EA1F3F|nr:centrosomal protein of 295 kDa isoform X2 [Archocentrus centrarchus]
MKRKVSRLRPSPNEEARIIREEQERRRKLRIQQVREQQRYIALQIRREVEQRRQYELQRLEQELRKEWEDEQREKLHKLQRLYQESLQLLGQGHRSAKENEPDLAAIAQREEENHTKAEERYREALKELKSQRIKDQEKQNQFINTRKKALQAEKERSAKVASLPLPPPNPIQNVSPKKPHIVRRSDVSAFATTHYHMYKSTVDREVDINQPNAHEEAELHVRRQQDLEKEERRKREEQLEKARLRGRQALRKEQLMQDRERLLVELEHMQQSDLLRRRQQVSQMPPQIFQPLYKRQEMREDFQREMEFAFEDMYTGERRVKGDLVVQLAPEPLPAHSTSSQDQELDVTLDEIATPETKNTQYDREQEPGGTEQETAAEVEPPKLAPRRALKKLLDRIRIQRNQWTDHSSCSSAADSPALIRDQIPERDTTIETGSLISGERDKWTPIALREAACSPPATSEKMLVPSSASDTQLPDVLAKRIQEFEEEQKKREEELEMEKQQQMSLLQDLEEQKAKLEQMLLEAQQERECLKAAVTQEEPIIQPEVPVHVHDVISDTPNLATDVVHPAGKDDHSRRIREYQQRLIEQNRMHQRVEVARQCLEEYQRALQIRYNMTATSLLPAVVPPGLNHPPLHNTQCLHLPGHVQVPPAPAGPVNNHVIPQMSVEVSTGESDTLTSLPILPDFSLASKPLPDEDESVSDGLRYQRLNVTSWLTDSIMEKVTEHLPERVRPLSVTKEPLPYKLYTKPHSSEGPLQPSCEPIQAMRSNVKEVTPLVPGHELAEPLASLYTESLSIREDDMQRQRRELQEAQRRVLEQREAMMLQQRQQEEARWRQEVEMAQMRRQKETLQALINADAKPVSQPDGETVVSENTNQKRLQLLASLLKAIEESNGGTLSHLEDSKEKDTFSEQQLSNSSQTVQSDVAAGPTLPSVLHSGILHPPRAAKPPVTRVRLGFLEMMTEQHELSAIQEVETSVDTSQHTGPDDGATVPSHAAHSDQQEELESSVVSDRTLQTPSASSSGQKTSERSASLGTSSGRSSLWRERLLLSGAAASPESSISDLVPRRKSPISSDSGRGADFFGPPVTSYRSPTESPNRPRGSDSLSSTSISTGSYITTDSEQNVNTDKSLPHKHTEGQESGDLRGISSLSGQSLCLKESSPAGPPGLSVDSVFNDSSIQCIIDKYTRELDLSLNMAGKTDSEGSRLAETSALVSQQSLVRVLERRGEDKSSRRHQSLLSGAAGTQRRALEVHNRVNPNVEEFSGEVLSPAEDHKQASFRPLIGQLADQSSCLAADRPLIDQLADQSSCLAADQPLIGQLADQSSCLAADQRNTALEQLVGHPSAHSSMIGHSPGQLFSLSMGQGGWDSTLSRMIGRFSHQSSSHWLSSVQDFYAGHLIGQMVSHQLTSWLDEAPDESQMRPLVGELDESAGQYSGSSGERSRVAICVSDEVSVPSHPTLPPEVSSHSASVPAVSSQTQDSTQQSPTSLTDLDSGRAEEFVGSDSFHPLLAEVTHNETADLSMTFHQPRRSVYSSPDGHPASRDCSVTTPVEFDSHSDPSSVESEPSPECLRAEEPNRCTAASSTLHESFFQFITTQCHPQESVLIVSPTMGTDVEQTAVILSNLSMCDDTPALVVSHPEERLEGFVPFGAEECQSDQGPNLRNASSISDKILEAAKEKGILEQSEITLVSLTDTTLQDQETTITEEEEEAVWVIKKPDGKTKEGQKGQKMEGAESTLIPEETPTNDSQTHSVTVLEFHWGLGQSHQEVNHHKLAALLQRSNCRVEEIKAKVALAKTQRELQASSESIEQPKTKTSQPVIRKAKTKAEPRHKASMKSKGGQAPQQMGKSGFIKEKKPQLLPPVNVCGPQKLDEVKICSLEQWKHNLSEMHQRTQRLYEQLEEVKHQKAIKSRQEDYAKNRLKAKEFHKKTLQKLRAKQTQQGSTLNVS